LERVAKNLQDKYSVQTRIISYEFSKLASPEEAEKLEKVLDEQT